MSRAYIPESKNVIPNGMQTDEGYWQAVLQEGEFARSLNSDYHDDSEYTAWSNESTHLPDSNNGSDMFSPDNWLEIQSIMDNDEVLTLEIVGCNRGGLLVAWKTLRGFVPASQLINFPQIDDELERLRQLQNRLGDWLDLRVIELNANKNRLILSERAAQVECGTRDQLLNTLAPNDIITGHITNICDFGAFVELGGLEGLVHISEISWGRVAHPADLLESGQEVEVFVLDVQPEQARVALSIKRLHPDPWQQVGERYHVGQIVQGHISNVVDFGAFVRLEEGLEGLVHYSELAEGHFLHPRNIVSEGKLVEARILSMDGNARRLGLTLRID